MKKTTTKQKAYDDAIELLKSVTAGKLEIEPTHLETPPDPSLGDIAFECFSLAPIFKKDPHIIAQHIAELINQQLEAVKKRSLILHATAMGPYVNFFINTARFAELLFKRIAEEGEKFGNSELYKNKRIVVEYSSPNTNKPLTLGHIRNIVLGYSVAEILKTQGWKVFKTEIRNDRGASICKTILAWQKWGGGKTPKSEKIKGDHFVGKFYVLFGEKLKENPSLSEEIQTCLKKWEDGEKETRKLWKMMQNWTIEGIEETYQLLGADFDEIFYESDIYKKGVEIVRKGFLDKVFVKDEKENIVAPLEQTHHIPNSVLLRADGTAVYMTQDLYLAQAKYKEFKFDKSLYVVSSEQNLHFKQLFMIFKLLNLPWADTSEHLSYGLVLLPEGKMKSREGRVVDADDLVEEVKNLAKKEIFARHKTLSEKLLDTRARQIALGAIKYYILQIDPKKDMVYHPEESLALQGNTGPYLQYTLVRIQSILKKTKTRSWKTLDYSVLQSPLEHQLILLLADFPEILSASAERRDPSLLAKYLYKLAQTFSGFYHEHQVIHAEDEALRSARVKLLSGIEFVLKKGLTLLGIECPEKM